MRAILLLTLLLSSSVSAQVYTWTDENGVKHFGSKPPTGQAHESVEIKDTNRSAAPQRDLSRSFERRTTERSQPRPRVTGPATERPDYICRGATNRAESAKERWDAAKRQGYTQSQKAYHEQRIRDAERHRDNICR